MEARINYHRLARDVAEKKLRKTIGNIVEGTIKNYFEQHPLASKNDWIRESLAKRMIGELCKADTRRRILTLIVNAEKAWLEDAGVLSAFLAELSESEKEETDGDPTGSQ